MDPYDSLQEHLVDIIMFCILELMFKFNNSWAFYFTLLKVPLSHEGDCFDEVDGTEL